MGGYQGKRGLRADPTRRNNPLVRAAGLAAFAAALPAERPGPGAALADDGTVYLAYCSLVEYGYAVTPAVLAAGQAVALRGERPGEVSFATAPQLPERAAAPVRRTSRCAGTRGGGSPAPSASFSRPGALWDWG